MAQILKCSFFFTGPLTQAKWHQLWWESCPTENWVKTGVRLRAVDLLKDYAQNWKDQSVFITKLIIILSIIKNTSGDNYCSLFFNIITFSLCYMAQLWSHLGFWIKSLTSMRRLLSASDLRWASSLRAQAKWASQYQRGLAGAYLHCTRTVVRTVAVTAPEELRPGIREVIQVSVVSSVQWEMHAGIQQNLVVSHCPGLRFAQTMMLVNII